MQLVIGRIAKPHGISGELAVEVRTDAPEQRFAAGSRVETDPSERGPLVVEATRWHAGRLLVRFTGVTDRTAADALRGTLLVADSATSPPGDADDYWDHDLVGLTAVLADGTVVGDVTEVAHPPGSDLLVVKRPDGRQAMLPFVREIVPTVDVAGGRIVVAPPDGLLDL
ncbi:MAG TPA: ribosome maturation factor RimM [Mycobacteriales bacterium]|jgi:16S rRNA processing protein RimM|nr:ribosome maturation factor RimM [Mycobacteriales bacterium]